MHAADALMSPTVAGVAGAASIALIAIASKKVKKIQKPDLAPLMGVMGAFVFAAQMINFTIPGTGSSGHLIGGVLLSAILGPWCGFLTLCSIIIVQCLFFADGGMLALGCNILNMGATSCLIAYPLIYKPIAGSNPKPWKIFAGSIAASIVALEIGSFAVTLETELSGVTALPFSTFLSFMLPIHLVIGLVEGIVTGALLVFLYSHSPSLLQNLNSGIKNNGPLSLEETGSERVTDSVKKKPRHALYIMAALTLILAGGFTILASEYPDGLEWSIEKVSGLTELESETPPTALMPDYDSGMAGILGSVIVMALLWGISSLFFQRIKKSAGKA